MVQKRNIKNEIILALLREKQVHLRAMSKLLKIPHSTLLREIKRLKEQNILEYNTIGKNRFISLKKGPESQYSVYEAEYYKTLKIIQQYPELAVIVEQVLESSKEGLIILFGSFAKGIAKKDSDIDLFIETESRERREKIENINSRIRVKIGKFDSKSPLGSEIVRDHAIIRGVEAFYEKNPVFD